MKARYSFLTVLPAAVWLAITAGSAVAAQTDVMQMRHGTAHDALYDMAFEAQHGVAVGAFGAVLATQDGGATWAVQKAPLGKLALLSVAIKAGKCIAVGQTGTIFTADDCQTWTPAVSGTKSRLLAVDVNALGVAYAVGGFGTVLRSGDWGKTWVPQPIDWKGITVDGAEPHLYDVHVAADSTPTVVGEFELILRGNATGKPWQVLHKGERSLFSLRVQEDGHAYAVGQSGAFLFSPDGVGGWVSHATGTDSILTGVQAMPNGAVIVSGINTLMVSKDAGFTWRRIVSPLVANSAIQALGSEAGNNKSPRLLAVGSYGSILQIQY